MGLKAILESLDGLPPAVAALYRAGDGDQDGMYVLDVDAVDGWGLANVANATAGLAEARKKLRLAEKAAREKTTELEKLQARAAELEDALADNPDAKDRKALEAKLEANLRKQFEAKERELASERDSLKGTLTAKQERLQKLLIDQAIAAAASGKYDFNRKILEGTLRGRLRVEADEEGNESLVVLDSNGEPMFGQGGRAASVEDMIADLAKDPDFGSVISLRNQQQGIKPGNNNNNRNGVGDRRPLSSGNKVRHLTDAEVADFRTFKAIAEQAARDGVELISPVPEG